MIDNQFVQLEANLYRVQKDNAYFHSKYSLLSLDPHSYNRWLAETLLPGTRLIIEPKIIGVAIALSYEGGHLVKAITKSGLEKKQAIMKNKNVPIQLQIKKNIEIRGVLYGPNLDGVSSEPLAINFLTKKNQMEEALKFCAFQILNSNQNQYQSLKELQKLGFEVPETEFTKFKSEVDLYVQLWREGELFAKYPTDGIVLKVNSKKLQKQLGGNLNCSKWSYAIRK